jgi:CheY-like chemotaxis protein
MDSAFAVIDTTVKAVTASKISAPFWQNALLELLKNPGIFWVILVSVVLWRFYKPLRYELLPNLSMLKVMGVEFSFVQASIAHAIDLAKKSKEFPGVQISNEDQQRVINRVRRNSHLFRGCRILWIDDFPDSLANERKMLQSLLVDVDLAISTATAERLLQAKGKKYNLILSDMKRDGDSLAGLKFLQDYAKRKKRPPVIFYIGYPDPTKPVPLHAFGITHRPDELLHLIMDALERVKS